MMVPVAFFDFDGTITRHDSFLRFSLHARGIGGTAKGIFKSLPVLILWRLHIISNSVAKEHLFANLFGGMEYQKFKMLGESFASIIKKDFRLETIKKLERHRLKGHRVVIVSASINEWIRPCAESIQADDVLATEVEIDDRGYLTGRFKTQNCHGHEKVRRILQSYPDIGTTVTFGYGDSSGDDAMLDFVTHGHRL